MIRFILLDIEGTTTDINFVHQTLFPYSAQHLPQYVRERQSDESVQNCLLQVANTIREEEGRAIDTEESIQTLLHWIQADRKHTALKALQGMVWQAGYETGAYQAHVYPDVMPSLIQWQQQGIMIGIYSSGSVFAQKLLFRHTVAGDLTLFFTHYFDTNVGGKREKHSYERIVEALQQPASEVLFLSDVEEELDAAHSAGLQVVRVNRGANDMQSKYSIVSNFNEIYLSNPTSLV